MLKQRNTLYLLLPVRDGPFLWQWKESSDGPILCEFCLFFFEKKTYKIFIKCKQTQTKKRETKADTDACRTLCAVSASMSPNAVEAERQSQCRTRGNHLRPKCYDDISFILLFVSPVLLCPLRRTLISPLVASHSKMRIQLAADIDKFPFVYCFIWNTKCLLMIML